MMEALASADVFGGIRLGFAVAGDPMNLLFAFLGCMLGTLVGVLPGLGTTATIAILLPATFALPPVTGLITLAGIYYGAQYGGSTTSILLRLPGEASSVVTVIDGHAMTRNGRAGAALSIAALSSFFAGTVATFFIAVFAPVLADAVLSFNAPEYFMLMAVGLIASIILAQGSVVRALAMIMLGLLLGMAGTDVNTGTGRFTFGFYQLAEGIPFVPIVVGLFGIADILVILERTAREEVMPAISRVTSLWPTRGEAREAAPAAARGTLIGLVLGLLPGRRRAAQLLRRLHRGEAPFAHARALRAGRPRRRRRTRKPPTMPARRRPSCRSSPSACRPTPSWRSWRAPCSSRASSPARAS